MQARREAFLAALQGAEGLYSTVTAIVVYGGATRPTFALGESQPPRVTHRIVSTPKKTRQKENTSEKPSRLPSSSQVAGGQDQHEIVILKGGVPYLVSRAYRAHHTIDTRQYTSSYTWRRQFTRLRSKTRHPRRLGGTFRDTHCDSVIDHAQRPSKTHRCP